MSSKPIMDMITAEQRRQHAAMQRMQQAEREAVDLWREDVANSAINTCLKVLNDEKATAPVATAVWLLEQACEDIQKGPFG